VGTDQVAVILAGLVWPFVFRLTQRWHGLQDRGAQWAAVVVCYVVAVVAVLGTAGQPVTAQLVLQDGSIMATVAALVYRQVVKPALPVDSPAVPPVRLG